MSENQICPECGCPRENNESVCEECGYRFTEETATQPTSPQEPQQLFTGDNTEFDYNESPNPKSPKSNRVLRILLSCVALIIVVCVGGYFWHDNNQKQVAAQRFQHEQDSIAAVQRELARLDSLRQDSIRKVDRMTPDLALFELHGPVKEVYGCIGPLWTNISNAKQIDGEWISTALFDINGRWTNSDEFSGSFMENIRFENGMLYEISFYENKFYNHKQTYQWENGRVASSKIEGYSGASLGYDEPRPYTQVYNFIYYEDNSIQLKKVIIQQKDETYTINSEYSYSDMKYDEYNNWISRKRTDITHGGYQDEIRTVIYYPLDSIK